MMGHYPWVLPPAWLVQSLQTWVEGMGACGQNVD